MLKAIYLFLALAAIGVLIWQFGFLFGIPGAPENPDMTITLSALTAAIIFFGLWYAGVANREKPQSKILLE
jgi:ABC-type amino acid transport system permease subunit